ncbi:amidase family protein [Saccharothrix australiensis]|uniref:Mandelamide amidase n=1 Tax=Saccharothrix australiensis TaxID=2072 RepID=A0A495W0T2_9PSEU|nr:amidase family protein [Saccharothrix australiensis]RKT55311.1 mandelamide amidase [Saccharothrix australiensis]
MADEVPTLSLGDWLALDPPERARHLFESVRRAGASTHGDWIGDVRALPSGPGPLAGIPFSVKDNIDVGGIATTAGSRLLDDRPAEVDAGVVSALRGAGAVVVGKTNLHELAFGITSDNKAFGPVRNPADPTRSAGGSSGGSAVGVALGVVPFGLGTDTGGSTTIPAGFCGVVGFRPTTGRYAGDGLVNLSTSRDTVGVHARTVRDVRVVDQVLTREPTDRTPPADLAGLRVGLPRGRFEDLDPEVAEVVDAAVAAVERAGARLVEVDAGEDLARAAGPGSGLVLFEAPRLLARRVSAPVADWPRLIASPDVRDIVRAMSSAPTTVEAYEAARAARRALQDTYAALRTRVDVLLCPTSPVPPPLLGENDVITHNGREVPVFTTVTRNVEPGTVAGVPMLSLPAGTTRGGLPVGVCLEGHAFGDARLLHVGEAVQAVLDGLG